MVIIIISFERKELLHRLANERERKKERKSRRNGRKKLRKNRCVTVHGVGSTDRDEFLSCSLAFTFSVSDNKRFVGDGTMENERQL